LDLTGFEELGTMASVFDFRMSGRGVFESSILSFYDTVFDLLSKVH